MKFISKLFLILVIPFSVVGQVPEAFNYQAVIRDNNHQVIVNQNVALQISILAESTEGDLEYRERHFIQTNQFGLVNLKVGEGERVTGIFSEIDWSIGNYYLQIEIDISGGTDFEFMGTTQMLSVPYALFAKNAQNIDDADADPENEIQAISISNDTIFLENGGFVKLPEQPTDNDLDATNEIQLISLSNDTIYLENGGFVKLPTDKIDDADNDPENELQAISISNDTIFLEDGGYVKLPFDQVNDLDADPENEIQVISINADTIFIEKGGYVILPEDEFEDADADPMNELQSFSISGSNDTLFLSNGNYVIIPGISEANVLSDFDGNIYETVKIGEQIWMKQDLKTTHYADGIPLVDGAGIGDISSDYTTKYYFEYEDDESNLDTYGRLYTWCAIMNGASSSNAIPSGVQGICPNGWHVPSYAEWLVLINYLGGESVAGGKMKIIGTTHWNSPNTGATNESGFTALAPGYRSYFGIYLGINTINDYWTATEGDNQPEYFAREIILLNSNAEAELDAAGRKNFGYSVRCIKN
jgi:uncharacterized protein (TIGR02145 family)